MASPNPKSRYSQSERLKRSFNLSSRDRRSWMNRLVAAQEKIEAAEEDATKILVAAWHAGMSYNALAAIMGAHPDTVRKMIDAHTGRTEQDQESGS